MVPAHGGSFLEGFVKEMPGEGAGGSLRDVQGFHLVEPKAAAAGMGRSGGGSDVDKGGKSMSYILALAERWQLIGGRAPWKIEVNGRAAENIRC